MNGAELIELMGMDQAEFSRRFKGSPVNRPKQALQRRAAIEREEWVREEILLASPL